MFGNLDLEKLGFLLVLGLFIFGPERLPTMAAEAGKALRQLRAALTGWTQELKDELGPELGELDLRVLHPKEFVRRHLFEDDSDQTPLTPPMSPTPARGGPPALHADELPPVDLEAT